MWKYESYMDEMGSDRAKIIGENICSPFDSRLFTNTVTFESI